MLLGYKFTIYPGKKLHRLKIWYKIPDMKKKETLWELLQRLDEEAAQFNMHLSEANRYFDTAQKKTITLLQKHEKDLHKTITKVQAALKTFMEQKDSGNSKKSK